MDASFEFKMRTILCLNRKLPYGDTGPGMDFFEAAFEGDIPRLREMASGKDAEEKALLAKVCFDGLGPLQVAARMGRLDVIRYLVEDLGFDVNHGSTDFGLTALSSAALDGRLDTVRYLLDNGANPNLQDELGEVPLHCAAKYGHDEVTELLLSRGASVDLTYFHATPLHIAAVFGKANVMKILLEHHADVKLTGTPEGYRYSLTGFEATWILEAPTLLRSYPASLPNMVSEVLGTPLVATLHATTEGLEESIALKCVKVLVEAGANVNSTDPDTPLVVATTHGLTDCIKYLLKAGANANIPNRCCGAMPIETAASSGRRKHVEMLFPFTSSIETVSKWTVDGIISHVRSKRSKHSKPKVGQYDQNTKVKLKLDGDKAVGIKNNLATSKLSGEAQQYGKSMKDELKLNGDKAVGRKDYLTASELYGKAIELDPADATLYSSRSLCLLRIGKATKALSDASTCIKMRPEWVKGYYRKGTALMSLKEYKEACGAFMAGFKLDPSNAEMERLFWEAAEAMKKDHVGKGLEFID